MASDRQAILDRIINRPEMLAALAPGYDHVDMSRFFANPMNVMLTEPTCNAAAIFAYRAQDPDTYEGHYLLEAGHPGNRQVCRDFLHEMFTAHRARAIWGYTPTENRAARALSRALGFAPRGHSLLPSGRPCVVYVLERDKWARSSGVSSAELAVSAER